MTRVLCLAAAAVALCACTPMQWVREGGVVPEPAALENDSAGCRQLAWSEAQYRAWAYRPFPYVSRDAFGRSYVAWPYGYPYGYRDPFFEEARLMNFCMRAKGYELVPVESAAAR